MRLALGIILVLICVVLWVAFRSADIDETEDSPNRAYVMRSLKIISVIAAVGTVLGFISFVMHPGE